VIHNTQLVLVALVAFFCVGVAHAEVAAEYVQSSEGVIGTFEIDTEPVTTVYAMSYADEPSIADTSYVMVRNDTMVAAVLLGVVWLMNEDGTFDVYESAAVPVALLPDRELFTAMMEGTFMAVMGNETEDVSTSDDSFAVTNESAMNATQSGLAQGEGPFDWEGYAEEYDN
jgi:hypothetical protein